MTPTARSLKRLRDRGALAAVVERWNPHAKVRQDLFGFADIVAVEPGQGGVLAIQACVTGDQSKRLAKLRSAPVVGRVGLWLAAGNRVSVWGWALRGPRGKRKVATLSETVVDGLVPPPDPKPQNRAQAAQEAPGGDFVAAAAG